MLRLYFSESLEFLQKAGGCFFSMPSALPLYRDPFHDSYRVEKSNHIVSNFVGESVDVRLEL
jgi:hypothetical protein